MPTTTASRKLNRVTACALALLSAPALLLAQGSDSSNTAMIERSVMPTAAAANGSPPQKTFFVRSDLAWTAAALAGTGIVSIFDKRIAHYTQEPNVQGSTSRQNLAHNVTKVNETTLTAAAIIGYGAGRLFGSSMVADVGLHTTESLLFTSAISQIIRGPLGRERPSLSPDDQYKFQFGKGFTQFNNRSFPSLHSATAFAAAASIVGEVKERSPGAVWYVAPVLYTAAAVPGLTRMYLNQHWASDVFSGAFVGTLIGARVVSYSHSHNRSRVDKWLLGTSVMPDGHGGVAVSYSMDR